MTKEPLRHTLGDRIYGCDACQDACPYNRGAWTGQRIFPGLKALGAQLSLVGLLEADYGYLEKTLQPLLWYIPADKCWRYKTNALNAMLNNYRPEYLPSIQRACGDEKEPVREMAQWVLQQLDARR